MLNNLNLEKYTNVLKIEETKKRKKKKKEEGENKDKKALQISSCSK